MNIFPACTGRGQFLFFFFQIQNKKVTHDRPWNTQIRCRCVSRNELTGPGYRRPYPMKKKENEKKYCAIESKMLDAEHWERHVDV